jgi:uncharacterized membrane protein
VSLAVDEAPDGWTVALRGGGFEVQGVTVEPDSPPDLTLSVTVPETASAGTYRIRVRATSGDLSDTLVVTVRVSEEAGGQVRLETDFPELRGASDATFTFNLTLRNDTPQNRTFAIAAVGPEGWDVSARPTTQEQAASVTVDAGSSSSIRVEADPPDNVPAGEYTITFRATSGEQTVEQELRVQITGQYQITLTTPNQVLSTRGVAGSPITQAIVVRNTGTAELQGVRLSGSGPSGWEIRFDPQGPIESIPPDNEVQVNAIITPSGDAIAGDYEVRISAQTDEANAEQTIRVTVDAAPTWLFLGLGLIVATFAGLAFVFNRFGRR